MSAGQGRLALTPERRGMLAKAHLARVQLGLEEAAYRDVVERVGGARSAALLSDAALHRLLAEFARLGWTPRRAQAAPRRAGQAQLRMIHAVWLDLQPHLADGSEAALRSFVRRQTRNPVHPDGVAAVEFLDAKQAARVLEGLKAWLARVRRA